MFRRVATVVIAMVFTALTTAAPAVAAGNGNAHAGGGGTVATPDGDFHCC